MAKWTPELHSALVMAVANVLVAHGIHHDDAAENEGWTLAMVDDFAEFMQRQVEAVNPKESTNA